MAMDSRIYMAAGSSNTRNSINSTSVAQSHSVHSQAQGVVLLLISDQDHSDWCRACCSSTTAQSYPREVSAAGTWMGNQRWQQACSMMWCQNTWWGATLATKRPQR